MPKISVIVPVYNSSKYLRDCLDSLTNQTFKDLEIIAIDDSSTDESLDILNEYASNFSNVKVYHNSQNQGQSITRNRGIDLATGKYISFIDSDDYVEPAMYEIINSEIEKNNNPDLITTGISFTDPDNPKKTNPNYQQRWHGRPLDLNKNPEELYWQSPSCCNKVFSRNLIDDYRFIPDCTWEDVAFTYAMLIKANSIINVTDSLYYYRRDIKDGVSSKGYKPNAPLDDIFTVADEIQKQARLWHKEEVFSHYIPLLQQAVCLQRLKEINSWPVPEEEKQERMQEHYQKIIDHYGEISKDDEAYLSAKADISFIEKFEKPTTEAKRL